MQTPSGKLSLSFPGTMAALQETARKVEVFGEETNGSPRKQYILSLVFEELATNAVKYGSSGGKKPADLSLEIHFDAEKEEFFFRLRDNGSPFDPLEYLRTHPESKDDEKEIIIGGAGLLLVKKMTTSFTYRREENWNIVETTF